jgi:hypothetical protein
MLREVRRSCCFYALYIILHRARLQQQLNYAVPLHWCEQECVWHHACMHVGVSHHPSSAVSNPSMQRLQALATETVEAEVATAAAQNGNGKPEVSSNGNGNGNGNGASSNGATSNGNGVTTVKVVLPSPPATISSSAASTNGNGASANGNSNGAATSTAAAAAATVAAAVAAPAAAAAVKQQQQEAERIRMMNTIDEEQNAEAAGQLELAAATGGRKQRSAAGTPYKAPGGNWSKFKTYSVWQVCIVFACVSHVCGCCSVAAALCLHVCRMCVVAVVWQLHGVSNARLVLLVHAEVGHSRV